MFKLINAIYFLVEIMFTLLIVLTYTLNIYALQNIL